MTLFYDWYIIFWDKAPVIICAPTNLVYATMILSSIWFSILWAFSMNIVVHHALTLKLTHWYPVMFVIPLPLFARGTMHYVLGLSIHLSLSDQPHLPTDCPSWCQSVRLPVQRKLVRRYWKPMEGMVSNLEWSPFVPFPNFGTILT